MRGRLLRGRPRTNEAKEGALSRPRALPVQPSTRGLPMTTTTTRVTHQTVKIDGVDVFYREAGPKDAPAVLLLHGFPASSFMFRNLIPQLATRYHVIAPDYPGYGQSASPAHDQFAYTFDHLASVVDQLTQNLKLNKYTMYVQDYGAPVGYRLAYAHPDRITG